MNYKGELEMKTKLITFRTFKKHCRHKEVIPYRTTICKNTYYNLKCCEKNCPVFKNKKGAK